MASMSNITRKRIVDVASANGFIVETNADGQDLYDKNLVFRTRALAKRLYINRETGISKTSGEFSYLKVAVHPDEFDLGLVSPVDGIHDYVNIQSKTNRHHSSNYRDFPAGIPGRGEPYGCCYKVMTLPGLAKLLANLRKST